MILRTDPIILSILEIQSRFFKCKEAYSKNLYQGIPNSIDCLKQYKPGLSTYLNTKFIGKNSFRPNMSSVIRVNNEKSWFASNSEEYSDNKRYKTPVPNKSQAAYPHRKLTQKYNDYPQDNYTRKASNTKQKINSKSRYNSFYDKAKGNERAKSCLKSTEKYITNQPYKMK